MLARAAVGKWVVKATEFVCGDCVECYGLHLMPPVAYC